MLLDSIDVGFDFTSDTPHYWDNFWDNNGLGTGGADPDIASDMLRTYHRLLWSKQLPNGEHMSLQAGTRSDYLFWKNFRFGSDSITASFRYKNYKSMLCQVAASIPDYRAFMENYIHRTYTIGGAIIFPKHKYSINQARGCTRQIRDRWDLTLECIRRYYLGQPSPLYDVLLQDQAFFDLFVDFRGYVDFFFLQDCVTADYASVHFLIGDGSFPNPPLPRSVGEYLSWIDAELDFVSARNSRIQEFIRKN